MPQFAYSVEVIGFNQTERIILSSIFGLSARRAPKFTQHTSVAFQPDLFLVDASDQHAVALFRERNSSRSIPAIMIGDTDCGLGYPVLARPLQWTKLFKAFDLGVAQMKPSEGGDEKTRPNPVISRGAPPPPGMPAESLSPQPLRPAATPPKAEPAAPASAPVVAAAFAPSAAPAAAVRTGFVQPVPPASPQRPAATTTAAQSAADWVLVVDDNLTVREFMKTKLAPFGFNVDYAESGEQAIGFTGQKQYACIFLDVIMPGVDGYQVCKMIKSKKQIRNTAIVMLTSKSSPFDKIRGAMAGCDAYLTKPVVEDKLLATIAKYLPVQS